MMDYATIAVKPRQGYTITHTTNTLLIEKDIRRLALPSGSKWMDVSSYKCLKISPFPNRCVGISACIIVPDRDEGGRPGLIYANIVALKSTEWLAILRGSVDFREEIRLIYKRFPFPDNKIDLFFSDWQPADVYDVDPLKVAFDKVKVFLGRRVIIGGKISTPQGWERYANYLFQLARSSAGYYKTVSFTTLTLNVADTSQIIAIPFDLIHD